MYRAPRVVNKYLDLYEHQRSYAIHTRKLETMKPTIDVSTPKEAGRFVLYRERRKKEMEMQLEIDRICQESVTIRESQRSTKKSGTRRDPNETITLTDNDGLTVIDRKSPRSPRFSQKPTITRPVIQKNQSPRAGPRPGVFSPVRQPSPRTNGAPRRKQGDQIIPPVSKYVPPAIPVEGGEFAFQAEIESKPEQNEIIEETFSTQLRVEEQNEDTETKDPQVYQESLNNDEEEKLSLTKPIVEAITNTSDPNDKNAEKQDLQKDESSDFSSDSFDDDNNNEKEERGENEIKEDNDAETQKEFDNEFSSNEENSDKMPIRESTNEKVESNSDFESENNSNSENDFDSDKKENDKSESDHFEDESDDFNSDESNNDDESKPQPSEKVENQDNNNGDEDFVEPEAPPPEDKGENDDEWDSEPQVEKEIEKPQDNTDDDEQKVNPSLSSFTGDILGKFIADDGEANDEDFDLDSLLPSKRGGIEDFELE